MFDKGYPQYIDKKGRNIKTRPFNNQAIVAYSFTSTLPSARRQKDYLLSIAPYMQMSLPTNPVRIWDLS
jgi:hypothetical protein